MKQIKITVSVDGNEVTRVYDPNSFEKGLLDWDSKIEDMLDTIEHSKDQIK